MQCGSGLITDQIDLHDRLVQQPYVPAGGDAVCGRADAGHLLSTAADGVPD